VSSRCHGSSEVGSGVSVTAGSVLMWRRRACAG
jgi:hypothetical protein